MKGNVQDMNRIERSISKKIFAFSLTTTIEESSFLRVSKSAIFEQPQVTGRVNIAYWASERVITNALEMRLLGVVSLSHKIIRVISQPSTAFDSPMKYNCDSAS
jgi:hypothetical protein